MKEAKFNYLSEKKVIIAYVIRPAVGGMKNHLIGLLDHIDRDKFEPMVFSPFDQSLKSAVDEKEIAFIDIDIPDKISPVKDFKAIYSLRKRLKEIRPDLVHIHGNKSAFIGRIAAKGIAPVVVTVHNFLEESHKGFVGIIVRSIERFFSGWTDKIICVSAVLRRNLMRTYRISRQKIDCIPNGLDFDQWASMTDKKQAKEALNFDPELKLIGIIGRLVNFKGHKYAIEALPGIIELDPSIRLLIVGDGPNREQLEVQARELGIESHVVFLGQVEDVKIVYSALDYFLFPSTNEPFGIAILEAMAAEVPIIASDAGAIGEILEHNETGLLVRPMDSQDISRTVKELIIDSSLAETLTRNAKNKVIENYSICNMVNKTMGVYSSLLQDGYN